MPENNDIAGVSIACSAPKVSHLFFADDSLIFLKATATEFGCFKAILTDYECVSGQCINLDKSVVCFSENVSRDTKSYLGSILHIRIVDNLGSSLGLPSSFLRGKS